jgi:hypothetical protein
MWGGVEMTELDPPWQPIATAPRDGTLLDVRFDPTTAEVDAVGSLAEFYAPGCTRRRKPAEPVITGVEFSNGHFRPVCQGSPDVKMHGIVSVTLTHWRPAVF